MTEVAAPRSGPPRPGRSIASDDRLARRATKGDRRAFAAIYRRYHQRLYRFCLAIVGNSDDAQDALQNTMVKVLRALPGEKRQIQLKPWLYRIAHNESIELVRRRRGTEELDAEQVAVGPGLAEEAAARERLRRLIADLDELPERQRATLLMRELAGLEFAEIGTALDTSPATARQTLYEARLSLHEMEEGREMSCDAVTRALSDADGRVTRRRDLRAHLRSCASCRRFGEELDARRHDLAALAPLPLVAATGLLHGILGGGTAKALGTTAAVKAAAAVAVVAVVGVSADRGGIVDLGVPGGAGGPPASERAAPALAAPGERAAGVRAGSTRPAVARARRRAGLAASRAAAAAAAAAGVRAGRVGASEPGSAASAPSDNPAGHPRGRGHEKQHPGAAAHGQQTAAAHKGGSQGHANSGHPAHPAEPVHPSHPAPPPSPSPATSKEGSGSQQQSQGSGGGEQTPVEHPSASAGAQSVPPPPAPETGP
jgi:RNA polymerase sigma factor (sigma-70 family)